MGDNLEKFNQKLKIALHMPVTTSPNISLNLLGEYLTSKSEKRKRRILEQLKYPKDNTFPYVANDAKEAIRGYLVKGFDDRVIEKSIEAYKKREAGSASTQGQIDACIAGLEIAMTGEADFNTGFTYKKYTGNNPKLNVQGVEVKVTPDLIIRSTSRNRNYVGALKIHLSKSSPIEEEGGKYIAAVLYYFVEKYVQKRGESVKHNHCLSFDVHTDSLVECPKAVKNRWDEIEAGCMNIAAIWDSI